MGCVNQALVSVPGVLGGLWRVPLLTSLFPFQTPLMGASGGPALLQFTLFGLQEPAVPGVVAALGALPSSDVLLTLPSLLKMTPLSQPLHQCSGPSFLKTYGTTQGLLRAAAQTWPH